MLYFDHNATSRLLPEARDAWLDTIERFPANPSSPHRLGARAEAALQEAREHAAALLGCSPFNLVWTSGATEAANALMHHLAHHAEGRCWVSAIEHPCILAAAQRWFPGRVQRIPVTPAGIVDLDWLSSELRRERPAAVVVMAANNETGVIQPWPAILQACRERDVAFVCDAVQWAGKLPSKELGGCDFVLVSAHKFGGPPGIGALKVPPGFKPLLVGGPQEDGRRAGTENLPAIRAMTAAWSHRERLLSSGESFRREGWRDGFVARLLERIPGVKRVGAGAPRLWNTATVIMPSVPDCRWRWVVQLDRAGAAVSTGSACASGKARPSHVLKAMGYPDGDADRMIRFSAGWETPEEAWSRLLEVVATAATRLRVTGVT